MSKCDKGEKKDGRGRCRDYTMEYQRDHASHRAIQQRSERNQARAREEDKGNVHKGDGREVDHIRPLSKGGSNSDENTRVVSRHANRVKGAKT